MGIAAGILGMLTPIATGLLFSNVIPSADMSQLMELVIALGVSAGAVALFHIVRSLAIIRIKARLGGATEAAVWDQQGRQWVPLDSSYRTSIKQGLRIARKQSAPDLIRLPLPAAQAGGES